jgi:hypothetical protein
MAKRFNKWRVVPGSSTVMKVAAAKGNYQDGRSSDFSNPQ